jgi:hypothetical protein
LSAGTIPEFRRRPRFQLNTSLRKPDHLRPKRRRRLAARAQHPCRRERLRRGRGHTTANGASTLTFEFIMPDSDIIVEPVFNSFMTITGVTVTPDTLDSTINSAQCFKSYGKFFYSVNLKNPLYTKRFKVYLL